MATAQRERERESQTSLRIWHVWLNSTYVVLASQAPGACQDGAVDDKWQVRNLKAFNKNLQGPEENPAD